MIVQVLLPAGLMLIMFAVGLRLSVGDFRRLVDEPKAMAAGLGCQLLLLPLVATAILVVWPLEPAFAVGLMVLAACPGGITSNLLTQLARGDVALAISITAVTNLASVVTLPLIVALATDHYFGLRGDVALPAGRTVVSVFLIAVLPLVLAMLAKRRLPALTARWEPRLRRVAVAIFTIIVLGTFASQGQHFVDHGLAVGPAVLALNVLTMGLAFAVGKAVGVSEPRAVAMSMECGLQNAAMAIFVATALLGRPDIAVPAILYAFSMNLTAFTVIYLRSRHRVTAGGVS